jgi:hypothetical protein
MTVDLEVRLISGDVLAAVHAEPKWTAADIKAVLRDAASVKRIAQLVVVPLKQSNEEFPHVGADVEVCQCFRWQKGQIVEINSDGDIGRIDAVIDGKIEKSIGTTRYRKPAKQVNLLEGKRTVEEAGLLDGQSYLQAVVGSYAGTISLNEFDSISFHEDGTYTFSRFEFAGSSMCGGQMHTSKGTWTVDKNTGELITNSGSRYDADKLR